MLRCRLFGHRPHFWTEGTKMLWGCERCGQTMGEKSYGSPGDAERYARGLNIEDREKTGHRAPLGALPLRLWRMIRRRG